MKEAAKDASQPSRAAAVPESHDSQGISHAAVLPYQKKSAADAGDTNAAGAENAAPAANRTGLPDDLKQGIESLSAYSLDDVKVHYNSARPAQLQAYAFAQGTDIHVAPGQERHLPHEAWHVVQQKQGRVQPTTQLYSGVPVNDDTGLEAEADAMGARALTQRAAVTAWKPAVQRAPVVQRADYAEKYKEEKARTLERLKQLNLAGISSLEAKDFTWHHKYPHSLLEADSRPGVKKMKDARSYIALGPNPAARLDDPGNTGTDLNYRRTLRIDTSAEAEGEDIPEPLTPRSRRLKTAHEKTGFEDMTDEIAVSPDMQQEDRGRDDIDLPTVEAEWSQWFIPQEELRNIFSEAGIREKLNAEALNPALASVSAPEGASAFKRAETFLGTKMNNLLHDYQVMQPDSGGKKFEAQERQGVPVTNLTVANLGAFHPLVDTLLKDRKKWLRRGAMGEALDMARKRLLALDQQKYSEKNVTAIARKFDKGEALKLMQTTSINPRSAQKAANVFENLGLGKEFTAMSGGKPFAAPEEIDALIKNDKAFEELKASLLKRIEELVDSADDTQLLQWSAKYLSSGYIPEDEEETAMAGLKAFVTAFEANAKIADAKPKQRSGGRGRRGAAQAEAVAPARKTTGTLLAEHEIMGRLLGKKPEEGDEAEPDADMALLPGLLQTRGNDPFDVSHHAVASLHEGYDKDDTGASWEVPDGAKREYENYISKGGGDSYDVFKKQQQIAGLDLSADLVGEEGLSEAALGMLALKASMLDVFVNIPRQKLRAKEEQNRLADEIIKDIKTLLAAKQKTWTASLKESESKLGEGYLKTRIRDLMHSITPGATEDPADWERRLQDEVSTRLLMDIINEPEKTESESPGTTTATGTPSAGTPKPSRSTLGDYLDRTLPGGGGGGAIAKKAEARQEVTDHLKNYYDPDKKIFNKNLWDLVKGQILARVDAETEALYNTIAADMQRDPSLMLDKPAKKEEAVAPVSGKKEKLPYAALADVLHINVVDNPGGGDCLFYALNGTSVAEDALATRREIAAGQAGITRHDLMTILTETPGLSRFARRVPAIPLEGFDIPAVYRTILETPHTWGGRTEIAAFARLRNVRVALVEIEGGIESVRVYTAAGPGPEILSPNNEQLTAAFAGSTILIHQGGNHWLRGNAAG